MQECIADLQESYNEYRVTLLEELGDPACSDNDDCVLVDVETRCRIDCGAALHAAVADELLSELAQWAEKNCEACPQADIECDALGMTVQVECVDGVCERR
jgi:hypothetical protein